MAETVQSPHSDDPDPINDNVGNWRSLANCTNTDPDIFFPTGGNTTLEAKDICCGCVVREDCLEYALANGEKFGVWGGLTERERKRIRLQRAIINRVIAES